MNKKQLKENPSENDELLSKTSAVVETSIVATSAGMVMATAAASDLGLTAAAPAAIVLGTIVGGATLAGALYAASKAPSISCDEEDES